MINQLFYSEFIAPYNTGSSEGTYTGLIETITSDFDRPFEDKMLRYEYHSLTVAIMPITLEAQHIGFGVEIISYDMRNPYIKVVRCGSAEEVCDLTDSLIGDMFKDFVMNFYKDMTSYGWWSNPNYK
jgi:hypothetical protein